MSTEKKPTPEQVEQVEQAAEQAAEAQPTPQQAEQAAEQAAKRTAERFNINIDERGAALIAEATVTALEQKGVFDESPPTPVSSPMVPEPAIEQVVPVDVGEHTSAAGSEIDQPPKKRSFAARFLGMDGE